MARRGSRRGGAIVDISVEGGVELQRKLRTLDRRIQRKMVSQSLREAGKRIVKPRCDAEIAKISPGKFGTGRLRTLGVKVRALKTRKRGFIGIQVALPSRKALDIGPKEEYYPAILEYGSPDIRPRRYMRTAREKSGAAFDRFIRRELKRRIEAEVTRLGRVRARLGL